MSTWISENPNRALAGRLWPASARFSTAALLFSLAGCGGFDAGGGPGLFAQKAPEKARVVQNTVTIAGPRGYCVDTTATRDDARGAFVLLASCASISGSARQPKPDHPAILTATVAAEESGRPIADSTDRLKAFFTSDAGRAALSKNGKAESVTVLSTSANDGVFYLHARDKSGALVSGAGEDYWRAMLDVKGRVVSASLVGVNNQPISDDAALATLQKFTRRIQRENRVSAQTDAAMQQARKTGLPGFLRRLFP